VWDAATGQQLLTLKGHTGMVRSVAFSPDGQRIITGSDDWTAKLWNAETGLETFTLPKHTEMVWSVAFSPDGHRHRRCWRHGQTVVRPTDAVACNRGRIWRRRKRRARNDLRRGTLSAPKQLRSIPRCLVGNPTGATGRNEQRRSDLDWGRDARLRKQEVTRSLHILPPKKDFIISGRPAITPPWLAHFS